MRWAARAQELARASDRPRDARGIALTPLAREDGDDGYRYELRRRRDRPRGAHGHVHRARADGAQPADIAGIEAAGAAWWPLAMARELDDAILTMRTNELAIGTWLFKTAGDVDAVLAVRRGARRARRTTGWCARRSACSAARSRASTSRRARCSR